MSLLDTAKAIKNRPKKIPVPEDWPVNNYIAKIKEAAEKKSFFNPLKAMQDPIRPAFKSVVDERDQQILRYLQEKGIKL